MSGILIPLGTNGYYPSYGRQTACFLYMTPTDALVLDAGTGLSWLAEPALQDILRDYDHLNILLSHYHMDHVTGLFYLPAVWNRGPVTIYAPTCPYTPADPLKVFDALLAKPVCSKKLSELDLDVEVVPVSSDHLMIGSLNLKIWAQKHPGGSIGIRINDDIAYCTDKSIEPVSEPQINGVHTLLHEVWYTDEEAREDPATLQTHSACGEVAAFAADKDITNLIPIHHHPAHTEKQLHTIVEQLEAESGISTFLPREGHSYPLIPGTEA
ncbi:MAG: MBL fold metallo-hydrolase [Verrucomicrobia bacterium]|nr:MBL fold metallo-hydrolase [Verrucomicrobiota bacterium]